MTQPARFVIPVVLGALAAAACGAKPMTLGAPVERRSLDTAAQTQHQQLVGEGDALWGERGDESKLREAIAKWDAAVRLKSDDAATYEKLAHACYFLADGFLAFKTDSDAGQAEFLAAHEKGLAYAEQGLLAVSPDFEKRRRAGTKFEDAAMVLGREAVPLMYWYGSNLGKWAKFKGISTTLKYKDVIFNTISRVYELDSEFFFGAPDRYFGSYYAVAPSFAGGDLNKSLEYFTKSVKRAPYYLATHVLIADLYATKRQDRALFERELKFVLDTPSTSIPELVPEHDIEKKKAQKLLGEINDRF